ncbi:PAS domain S-box protein [Methanoculleus sp. FWC-SCC1]|uniref:histidine kinase n=1 Tax=Methanoculleus frigidifontis TaxID=2584085 RepID=A0ABT8M5T5_9EURY|nr:PAS domain S-box protein [Methanoculleus sp. FWC-SCC1]MDN7023298.1 PAS domain S-box protein [Methanoculleus sp. FWC-SCC1]
MEDGVPIHILHVDDEESLLDITRIYLEQREQIRVTSSVSATDALKDIRTGRFDAIVSDYQMPDIDGIEFLRRIRAAGIDTPFLIFTGRGREEVVIEALNAGADFYVQKGGRPGSQFAELAHKIRRAVERRRAERSLKSSEENFRTIFETAPDLILSVDRSGTIVECNSRITDVLGYTRKEIIGKPIDAFVHTDSFPSTRETLSATLDRGSVRNLQCRMIRNGGGTRNVRINSSAIRNQDGEYYRSVCIIENVTRRKQAQKEVLAEKERLKVTLRSIGDGVIVTDTDGRIVLINRVAEELTGWSEEAASGRPLSEVFVIINEETRAPCENPVEKVLESGKIIGLANHTALIARDGTERLIADSGAPVRDGGGEIIGVVLVFRDVTEERRRDEEIRRYEREYRQLADHLPHIVYKADTDGNIIFMNQSGLAAFEVTEEAILNQPFMPNIHPDDLPAGLRVFDDLLTTGTPITNFECRFVARRGTGRVFPVITNVTAIRDSEGRITGTQGIALDISEKKKIEDTLREREEKLRFLLNQLPVTLWTTDTDLIFTSSLGAALASLSLAPNQVVGMPLQEFYRDYPGAHTALACHHQALSGDMVRFETEFADTSFSVQIAPLRDTAGTIIGTLGIASDITPLKEAEAELREAKERLQFALEGADVGVWDWNLASGSVALNRRAMEILNLVEEGTDGGTANGGYTLPSATLPPINDALQRHLEGRGAVYEQDHRISGKEGQRRWISQVGKVIATGPGGEPLRMTGIVRDVTQQRQYQEMLAEANRKLNLLAGITRHDILNQITILSAYLELLEESYGSDPGISQSLESIRHASKTIQAQISFTRDYGNIGVEVPEWQPVQTLIHRAAVQAELSGIALEIGTGDLRIFADPLLEKVFFSLIDNAIRHGSRVTRIRVSFRQDGDTGLLTFEDDGEGVPASIKEKIFRRGFGKNTGYGLFLAQEILHLNDCVIREAGVEGAGARFEIVVPKGRYCTSTECT